MNRSWVRFPQAAQIRPPGTGWAFLYALLVAPLVFRAPEGPAVGPGCLVCPWAAARPRAVRAASFARRVGSKPGQAPPPPTGAAAWPSGPSSALHTGGAWCADVRSGASLRSSSRRYRCSMSPAVGTTWPHLTACTVPTFMPGSLVSHVFPLGVLHDLNCVRWYSSVSECRGGVGSIELRVIVLVSGLVTTCGWRRSFA